MDVFAASRPGVLLLVCDGMGGAPAGDVAARPRGGRRSRTGLGRRRRVRGRARAGGHAEASRRGGQRRHPGRGERASLGARHGHDVHGGGVLARGAVGRPGRRLARLPVSRRPAAAADARPGRSAARLIDEGILDPSQLAHFPYRHACSRRRWARGGQGSAGHHGITISRRTIASSSARTACTGPSMKRTIGDDPRRDAHGRRGDARAHRRRARRPAGPTT